MHDTLPIRLLVTGATGFIGSRLALHAQQCGMEVLATGRAALEVENDRLQELRSAGIIVETGTLQDVTLMRHLLSQCNTVIHLAAAQHESQMPASYFRAINVEIVATLLQECRRAGIQRLVYGSTMGVYGGASDQVLDETSPVMPDNAYTQSKLEAEALIRADDSALQTCIIRIAETYGPGDRRLLKLFRAIDRGQFVMIGAGNNRRQSIHVADLVRGLLLAAQSPSAVGETFILAGREALTTNQMVDSIAAALERKPPRIQLPLWPFSAAASLMETLLPPLHIQPPLHHRRLDFFRRSFLFSITKAHQRLGFQPEIDLQAGMRDTAKWYRSRGLLGSRRATEVASTQSV